MENKQMRTFKVCLKSGKFYIVKREKSLFGLWNWANSQYGAKILSICEVNNINVLSSEIESIEEIKEEELN